MTNTKTTKVEIVKYSIFAAFMLIFTVASSVGEIWLGVGLFGLGFLYFIKTVLTLLSIKYDLNKDNLTITKGILSTSSNTIPFKAMNDIQLNQKLSQRPWKAGDILILTGNDTPTVLKNVDNAKEFMNALTKAVNNA